MQKTTNYDLNKPDKEDFYNIEDFNANAEAIDAKLKELEESSNTANTGLSSHTKDKANPHGVTKAQVGLSNVPNVSTNDQTPTYTEATSNTALVSGEKLSVAFGKIAKAVSSFISHLGDTVGHITSAERTKWNAKLDATATAVNADKLDNLDSTAFMRSVNGYGSNLFGSYDLNTWVKAGCYSCENSCINVPPDTDGWADLLVFGGIDGRVTQIFSPWNKTSALYFRSLNGTTWDEWLNLSAFVKLAGGIMAGNLDMNNHKIMGCASTYAPTLMDQYSHAGIEIREKDYVMNGSTDIGYAPTLGFHWAGVMGACILMDASGNFHLINGNGAYSTLKTATANVIISDTAPEDTTALWVS